MKKGMTILALFSISILIYGCSPANVRDGRLPVMKGELELLPGSVALASLTLPSVEKMQTGAVFSVTPIESFGTQEKFYWGDLKKPIGQSAAIRLVGEGLLNDVPKGHVRSFIIRYKVAFSSLSEAQTTFPLLREDQLIHVQDGQRVEVVNWTFRLILLPSQDGRAFRVMTDDLRYYQPMSGYRRDDGLSEQATAADVRNIPVLIGFFYRYPQYETQEMRQQNAIFDYVVTLGDMEVEVGAAQITGWLPLQKNTDTAPYTIEIAVAEITSEPDDFLPALGDLVKGVKGTMSDLGM